MCGLAKSGSFGYTQGFSINIEIVDYLNLLATIFNSLIRYSNKIFLKFNLLSLYM